MKSDGAKTVNAAAARLPVSCLERSKEWYAKLGFKPFPKTEDLKDYALLEKDGAEIHLFPSPLVAELAKADKNICSVYLRSGRVDDYHKELAAAGVEMLFEPKDQPWMMREFAMNDPDSNMIIVGQCTVECKDA